MSFSQIVLWIMAVGALAGGADKILGDRFGLGEEFEKGIRMMGPLALGMAGIVCLTPLLRSGIRAVFVPGCAALHIDPAVFGALLANDMGGYALSMELANDPQTGKLFGVLVSSTLGATLVFNIPVGFGMVSEEKRIPFVRGLLIGLAAVPIGGATGGLAAGFPPGLVLRSMLPIAVIAVLLILGLKLCPKQMTAGCIWFGRLVGALCVVGLACAGFQKMTGTVLLPGMTPVEDALAIVAEIAIVLSGTFPVLRLVLRLLERPLTVVGRRMGLSVKSTSGLIFAMANSVSVFAMAGEMEDRGVTVNTAWVVTASAALGDHLGFTASVEPDMIFSLMATKMVGGLAAVALAMILTRGEADRPPAAASWR